MGAHTSILPDRTPPLALSLRQRGPSVRRSTGPPISSESATGTGVLATHAPRPPLERRPEGDDGPAPRGAGPSSRWPLAGHGSAPSQPGERTSTSADS